MTVANSWMPGAIRYPVGTAGSLIGGPAKCTLHTTESNPEKTTAMAVAKWMAANKPGSVYTLLVHPITGETVQMLSAAGSAKALSNRPRGVETNRRGKVHIQVSVVARAADPFTRFPMPGWERVLDWIDSWGVPRKWYGSPPKGVLDHVTTDVWNNSSGWAGHCCVPENLHHDPGAIDLNILFAGKGQTPPKPTPTPPSDFGTFTLQVEGSGTMTLRMLKNTSPDMTGGDVRSLQATLNTKGFNAGAVDGVFGNGTEAAVKRAQTKYKIAVDGIVGSVTMERLWEG
jgi:hypothetical protein